MFITKNISRLLKNVDQYEVVTFDIPTRCPHCNFSVYPTVVDHKALTYSSDKKLLIIAYRGDCCNIPFYATYEYASHKADILDVYPHLKPAILPTKIKELSSRFAELYEQSYTAEQNGHIELRLFKKSNYVT